MTRRWLPARSGVALVLANVRYWSTVAPLVRAQLARWEQGARAIGDPKLRAFAIEKLRDERFNAEVAATLATLAPRSCRARVVEAIVALQVLYDYLDVLGEQPHLDEDASARLSTALTDAVALSPNGRGGDYLQALVETVQSVLARLPSAATIAPVAQASAARCAEAQILNHRVPGSGIDGVRDWSSARAVGTGLGWQEFLAGASASVLAIGALIAAAADPGASRADAEELDALYLSIGALTMLDSVVDLQEDIAAGQLSYMELYDGPEAMASGLAQVARDAVARARRIPNGAHHIVTLVGVVAYYASAPAANTESARPLIAPVRRELAPLITPTLALMRGWRAAKRVRHA
jgi:hypothetical protein